MDTQTTGPVLWQFADAVLDEQSRELRVAGEPVSLPGRPFDVLLSLLRAEGELVTKEELFDSVWAGRVVTDGSLSQAIYAIRAALGDTDKTRLRTVHGYGFRLDVPIAVSGQHDPGTRLALSAGQELPGIEGWQLEARLETRPFNELWRIRKGDDQQVLKLALDSRAERALKREVTLHRILRQELGAGACMAPLLRWQFDAAPMWVSMPWYPSGSLADWVRSRGGVAQLPMERRLGLLAQVAETMARAHALGVMHKDLKPGNLLVDTSGTALRLHLSDFGSGAVDRRERLDGVTAMGFTQTLQGNSSSEPTTGTPTYLAPEVLAGEVFSERSDVYALGVVLYQLVTGDLRRPLAEGWQEDIDDAGLAELIKAACAGRPERRIASMSELAERLRSWAPAQAVAAVADAPGEQRVALCPFELLGLDQRSQQVISGLQDALAAVLMARGGLRIVLAGDLAARGVTVGDDRGIAQALSVQRLVRGSVQQVGDTLQINVRVMDGRSGDTMWAEAFRGQWSELFDLQDQIGRRLAETLGHSAPVQAAAADPGPAYEAYLQALSCLRDTNMSRVTAHQGGLVALEHIDRALTLNADYKEAHLLAALATCSAFNDAFLDRAVAEQRVARHLAALERLDATATELALVQAESALLIDMDARAALRILEPHHAALANTLFGRNLYGLVLGASGRLQEAAAEMEAFVREQPTDPTGVSSLANLYGFSPLANPPGAMTVLPRTRTKLPKHPAIALAMADLGYWSTGERRYLDVCIALQDEQSGWWHRMQLAYAQDDRPAMCAIVEQWRDRELAGAQEHHACYPSVYYAALGLVAAGAPMTDVAPLARQAADRIEQARRQSDSPRRMATASVLLALVGESEAALALADQALAKAPYEKDMPHAYSVHHELLRTWALLDAQEILLPQIERMLCINPSAVHFGSNWTYAPLHRMPAAMKIFNRAAKPYFERNRAALAPFWGELSALTA